VAESDKSRGMSKVKELIDVRSSINVMNADAAVVAVINVVDPA